jgi:hydroxymethylpyrimidine pyrophosphatase-like HAD family hydrolase
MSRLPRRRNLYRTDKEAYAFADAATDLAGHGEVDYQFSLSEMVIMAKFVFSSNKFERVEQTSVYKIFTLTAEAETMEEAYEKIEAQIPKGHHVWTWREEDNG